MTWRISSIFVAAVWLSGFIICESQDPNLLHVKEPMGSAAGSGGWGLHFSDDEDLMDSGSGSGSGQGNIDIPDKTRTIKTTAGFSRTTDHPLTNCEMARQNSQLRRCLPNGDFDSLQCEGDPGKSECWCSDLQGKKITGTLMEAPNFPSCDDGNNLHPCVYQRVKQMRSKLKGIFVPKCADDGQYEHTQCRGSMCYCVDKSSGSILPGTEVQVPDMPKCGDAAVVVPVDNTKELQPNKDEREDNIDIDDVSEPHKPTPEVVTIDKDSKTDETKKETDKFGEDNKTGRKEEEEGKSNQEDHHKDKVEKANDIMTQPGILAGIIGGSVVLLLCLVLLAMFIVYRMRKKDEGSYPLDEPRKTPNYNYVRAPEKEFYA